MTTADPAGSPDAARDADDRVDPALAAFRRAFNDHWGEGDPPGTPDDLYDRLADTLFEARRAGRSIEDAVDEMVVTLDRFWAGRLTPRARARLITWLEDHAC